jgi:hypothetical protein
MPLLPLLSMSMKSSTSLFHLVGVYRCLAIQRAKSHYGNGMLLSLIYRCLAVQRAKSLIDRMSAPVLLSGCLGVHDVPGS